MNLIVILLTMAHLYILYLWLSNSPLLFSLYGILIWIILVVLGVVTVVKMKQESVMKLTLIFSIGVMLFLFAVTIAIRFITSSMLLPP